MRMAAHCRPTVLYQMQTRGEMLQRRSRKQSLPPGIATTEDAPAPLPIAERVGIVQRKFGLSDREAEIVLLITRGRNVPAIAEELVISQNTVRTHIKRIYRACGAPRSPRAYRALRDCGDRRGPPLPGLDWIRSYHQVNHPFIP